MKHKVIAVPIDGEMLGKHLEEWCESKAGKASLKDLEYMIQRMDIFVLLEAFRHLNPGAKPPDFEAFRVPFFNNLENNPNFEVVTSDTNDALVNILTGIYRDAFQNGIMYAMTMPLEKKN